MDKVSHYSYCQYSYCEREESGASKYSTPWREEKTFPSHTHRGALYLEFEIFTNNIQFKTNQAFFKQNCPLFSLLEDPLYMYMSHVHVQTPINPYKSYSNIA